MAAAPIGNRAWPDRRRPGPPDRARLVSMKQVATTGQASGRADGDHRQHRPGHHRRLRGLRRQHRLGDRGPPAHPAGDRQRAQDQLDGDAVRHEHPDRRLGHLWPLCSPLNATCWGVLNEKLYFGTAAGHGLRGRARLSGQRRGDHGRAEDQLPALRQGRLFRMSMVRPLFTAGGAVIPAMRVNTDYGNDQPLSTDEYPGTRGRRRDLGHVDLWGTGTWGSMNTPYADWVWRAGHRHHGLAAHGDRGPTASRPSSTPSMQVGARAGDGAMSHTLIYGFDEALARWACERIPSALQPDHAGGRRERGAGCGRQAPGGLPLSRLRRAAR
jgi:hypothetical protein